MNETTTDHWLTIADIGREYDVPRSTILCWLRFGVRGIRLRGTLIGNKWKVRTSDVQAFFDSLTRLAVPELAGDSITCTAIDIVKPSELRRKIRDATRELKTIGLDPATLPASRRKKK